MSFRIRPSVPDDGHAIVAVMRKVGLDPLSEQRALYWKYWRPRTDWAGPRSLVLTKDDRILAHAGIVPGMLAWGDHQASTIHVIDWAAIPEAALGGRMLMKYIGGLADVLIAAGGSEDTLRMLPVLGFRRCGISYRYVRTLHPLRYLTSRVQWNWKLLPKFARGALSAMVAPAIERGAWTSRRLTAEQIQTIENVLPRSRDDAVIFKRSVAAFSYFLDCPFASLGLHSVERAGEVRGYFLLVYVLGQARIVDSWMDCDGPDGWTAMVQCAVAAAQNTPGVAELVTTEENPLVSQCLRAAGFRRRGPVAIQLLTKKGLQAPPTCPRVQMLDSDAAYHHPGFAEFWT